MSTIFHPVRRSIRFLIALLALSSACLAQASLEGPFATSNYSPLVQIFGLPPIADVNVFSRNSAEFSLRADISSQFALTENGRESTLMDGDSYRYTINYSAKPRNGVHWQLAIPYLAYRGGTIDGFIDEWHKIFGFPEGGRDINVKDRLQFSYIRDGKVLLDIQEQQAGVGDILLSGQWLLPQGRTSGATNYAWIASLKLPSGDKETLLGSGAVDLSIGFNGNKTGKIVGYDYQWFFSSGLLLLGKGYYLSDLQRRAVVFGGLGASLSLTPRLTFKTQFDAHSAFYSGTNVAEIGQEALPLTIGGGWKFSKQWRIDFAVSEDLMVDASPDVTFHFALYRELGAR